ncbi:MAG: HlyD family efflux transporter periplasmic adaptor subunit [Holosporales bacterium]|jgi:HlyD family secretion protein|nr:HlyD family efflux transporter periplasmic adaptor subunit [Holosporales bacterium]
MNITKIVSCVAFLALIGTTCVFVKRSNFFSDEMFYAGSLEATRVIVSSRLPSQIINFKVKAGDRLKTGDIIAELDNSELKIAWKRVNNKYERSVTLNKKGSLSNADLEAVQAEKDDIELKLKWCAIKAPIDGVILAKYKEFGEWVTQGTGLVLMADTKRLKAFFYVEYDKLAFLKIGQLVKCRLPEIPGKTFTGTISVISSESEFTPKNVQTRNERIRLVYKIQVNVENDDVETLKPGMTLETLFESIE